jgi:hypothetical protein
VIGPIFLTCADRAADAIAAPAVAAAWERASALEGYTVAGLAGHLARAVVTVETYLASTDDGPVRDDDLTDASGYLVAVLGEHDPVTSDLHRAVRVRGLEAAADGPGALAGDVRGTTARLRDGLDDAALRRPVRVRDGLALPLGEYLRTRVVELVVHLDDLAESVDGQPGDAFADPLPDEAYRVAAAVLAEAAARRAGGLAVVRSLARRERHPAAVRAL